MNRKERLRAWRDDYPAAVLVGSSEGRVDGMPGKGTPEGDALTESLRANVDLVVRSIEGDVPPRPGAGTPEGAICDREIHEQTIARVKRFIANAITS